jgi:tRNA (cytidine/uridine-2'-O-)-methyltransferase
MFNIVLYQPEIPPNTGNIIRLCANTGCELHLIRPLGFEMDDKRMRRAGLDYHEWADVRSYDNWDDFINKTSPVNLYTFSTKAARYHSEAAFREGDFLVFGPETRGLPRDIRAARGMDHCLRLPMLQNSRSMNLSNAVSVVVYEGWRQLGFKNSC